MTTLSLASLTPLTPFTLAADLTAAQAVFCVLGLLFAAGFVGLFFKSIRRNNALFAPCVIFTTILFSGVVVGALMWYLY